MIAKEELDSVDIDDIGNLEDLLGKVFIHEEKNGGIKYSLMVESLLEAGRFTSLQMSTL